MADRGRTEEYTDDSGCFVCGSRNPIGLHAEFELDPKEYRCMAKLQIPADFQGWQDVVHGGIIAALLDEACVYACRFIADQCVTAELQIRYRKPVPVETVLEVTGQLVQRKRSVWTAVSRLTIGDDCYAEAEAKVFIFNRKKDLAPVDSQIDS